MAPILENGDGDGDGDEVVVIEELIDDAQYDYSTLVEERVGQLNFFE